MKKGSEEKVGDGLGENLGESSGEITVWFDFFFGERLGNAWGNVWGTRGILWATIKIVLFVVLLCSKLWRMLFDGEYDGVFFLKKKNKKKNFFCKNLKLDYVPVVVMN